ncbi:hypothetical protein MJH12_11615, partial [bacterium]|nr:hypothetical protein [bacterium]
NKLGDQLFYCDYSLKKKDRYFLKRTAYILIDSQKTIRIDFVNSTNNAQEAQLSSHSKQWDEIKKAFESKFEEKLGNVTDESFKEAVEYFQNSINSSI